MNPRSQEPDEAKERQPSGKPGNAFFAPIGSLMSLAR